MAFVNNFLTGGCKRYTATGLNEIETYVPDNIIKMENGRDAMKFRQTKQIQGGDSVQFVVVGNFMEV